MTTVQTFESVVQSPAFEDKLIHIDDNGVRIRKVLRCMHKKLVLIGENKHLCVQYVIQHRYTRASYTHIHPFAKCHVLGVYSGTRTSLEYLGQITVVRTISLSEWFERDRGGHTFAGQIMGFKVQASQIGEQSYTRWFDNTGKLSGFKPTPRRDLQAPKCILFLPEKTDMNCFNEWRFKDLFNMEPMFVAFG